MGRYRCVLAMIGSPTSDGRTFEALTWRELPLTLSAQTTTPDFGGHGGGEVVGTIEEIGPVPSGGGALPAVINISGEGEFAQAVDGMVARSELRGISIDVAVEPTDVEFICDEEDEDGWCMAGHFIFATGEIGQAHIVAFPAFAESLIDPTPLDAPAEEEPEDEPAVAASVSGADFLARRRRRIETEDRDAVIAAAVPETPPLAWFANPGLSGPTRLRIGDDGRVLGHVAAWGTCHTGRDDVCVTPPRSESGYAYFATGEVEAMRTVDAAGHVGPMPFRLPCGVLTLGTGHAPVRGPGSDAQAAAEHYDHTGTAVADIVLGEDDHGIYAAGALRPGLSADRVRELRASAPSGDWRRIEGALEMVAVLAVNVPGFPVVEAGMRAAMTADGALVASSGSGQPEIMALVAAGARPLLTSEERRLSCPSCGGNGSSGRPAGTFGGPHPRELAALHRMERRLEAVERFTAAGVASGIGRP